MTRKVLLAVMAAYLLAGGRLASAGDHLNCMSVKDPLPKGTFPSVTLTSNTGRPTESGCLIKVPAKLCCDAVDKLGVPPQPGGAGPGNPTTPFCCYQIKCPKSTQPPMNVTDQFGARVVQPKLSKLLCAPVVPPGATTTTTISTTTTTTMCPTGDILCGTMCVNPSNDPNNCSMCGIVCPTGESCVSGSCTCPAGDTHCPSGCVNLVTDPNNCGTCAHVCPTGATCVSSTCTCPAGETACPSGCVNTMNDPNNCGMCGSVCSPVANAASEICTAGMCQVGSCNAGFADCNRQYSDGCEVNINTSVTNCGACGMMCGTANGTPAARRACA